MSIVALVYCNTYEYSQVLPAVSRGIQLLGGMDRFAKPSESIVLKPNLLTGADPERCITTHPAVFKAVIELFKATGARITYGDNPGVVTALISAAKAGLAGVADEMGIETADFITPVTREFPEAILQKKFTVVKAVNDHDALISIPKFKTHELTRITGCVKNQFGCVPFLEKRKFHARLQHTRDFAMMLLDLNASIRPRLYIMDAIMAMDGNGPSSGDPFPLNVLGFSEDPIALDATMCRLIGLDPELVPTISLGTQHGYGEGDERHIEVVGDRPETFRNPSFRVNRSAVEDIPKSALLSALMRLWLRQPAIRKKKCVRCGQCVEACPVEHKAVRFPEGNRKQPPRFDYDRCIRCYCCFEVCPEKAVHIRPALLNKMFT